MPVSNPDVATSGLTINTKVVYTLNVKRIRKKTYFTQTEMTASQI
jgi:hypothetical protein